MSGLGCISLNMLDSENQKLSLSAFMPISCLHFVIATPGKQMKGQNHTNLGTAVG
jgi:hypothetical protein